MKHLILCPEYPPAPIAAGGIGTYVVHISQLLAASGETVHVIGTLWPGAPKELEVLEDGRLIIHRIPSGNPNFLNLCHSITMERIKEMDGLYSSSFPPQSFSWQACQLIENLVMDEGIDVIEAQEFQAPLYYFQLRRALGLGPRKYPPCIVHLHSPTMMIAQHNDEDLYHPYFLSAGRFETHSIKAADALLCPSHYLANQAETYFGLKKGSIKVIPLPIGDSKILERQQETWKNGSICYVGRLERRKGILEWIDAAVKIAPCYPEATFDFVGANILSKENVSGEELIESRIPQKIRSRFRFWGGQERSQLSQFLIQARIAVVPSRWENFPNTCVEAMCSGVPVIASPEGGMAEMIVDGHNGWLAPNASPEGLTETLKRALDTSPDEIARMGQNAAGDIRNICNNQVILKRHLDFRKQIAFQGAIISKYLPKNLPCYKRPINEYLPRRYSVETQNTGLSVVVCCSHSTYGLDNCLKSLEKQTQKALTVTVLIDERTEEEAGKIFNNSKKMNWQLIRIKQSSSFEAKNSEIMSALGSKIKPTGFVFISSEDQLHEKFNDLVLSVFLHCPEVGIVSCWAEDPVSGKMVKTTACPSFPFQWLSNELVSFSAIRTEALVGAENFRQFYWPEYENWDLFNAVMADGWSAVIIPAILGKEEAIKKYGLRPYNFKPHGLMLREIIERFPNIITHDLQELLLIAISNGTYIMNEQIYCLKTEIAALQKDLKIKEKYLQHPRALMVKFLYKLKHKFNRNFSFRLNRLIDKFITKGKKT